MKPAVLFDFDGTLMDSEPAVIASYSHVFEVFGDISEFTEERRVEVIGPPLRTEMEKFFPGLDPEVIMEEYRRFQDERLKELMRPMDNAEKLLDHLKKEGYPVGIVTSRLRASLENILNVFDLREYFDVLVCQDDGLPSKPDPAGILLACEKTGRNSSVYVGDSVTDLKAGRNAGSFVIAVLTHEKKEKQLLDFGPDAAVRDLFEIAGILDGQGKDGWTRTEEKSC